MVDKILEIILYEKNF